jgi:hypothetical protein
MSTERNVSVLLLIGGRLLVEPADGGGYVVEGSHGIRTARVLTDGCVAIEDLDAAITKLQELRRKRKGETTAAEVRGLMSFMDQKQNFLGTGMSFEEWFTAKEVDRVMRGFTHQDRRERKARLELAGRLAVELAKIREVSIFATGLGEGAIESVLEGDAPGLIVSRGMFTFEDERAEIRDLNAPLWATFVKILDEAIAHARPPELAPAGASKH